MDVGADQETGRNDEILIPEGTEIPDSPLEEADTKAGGTDSHLDVCFHPSVLIWAPWQRERREHLSGIS